MSSYNRNREYINCEDEYEAEKLMWILSPNREQHRLKHMAIVNDKEIIVVLDDDSSHSITMLDKESVERLQKTARTIIQEGRKPFSVRAHRNTVQIDLG